MTDDVAIPRKTVINALKELSDHTFQINEWLRSSSFSCFIEAINSLFDDASIGYALENNHIIFDMQSTQKLRELSSAVDLVDEFQPEINIITSPQMQIIRELAVQALALVLASDGSESTVEIIQD